MQQGHCHQDGISLVGGISLGPPKVLQGWMVVEVGRSVMGC